MGRSGTDRFETSKERLSSNEQNVTGTSAKRVFMLSERPGGIAEDHALKRCFEARGVPTKVIDWKAPLSFLDPVDIVLVRTAWDYTTSLTGFLNALTDASRQATLINSIETVMWNVSKRYLLELAAQGIPTIPARFLEASNPSAIEAACRELGGEEFVIKPAVGAGGRGIVRFRRGSTDMACLEHLFASKHGVLVQPFVDSVVTHGEWSLLFFARKLAHAALKTVAPGEYRTQRQYGGNEEKGAPPEDVITAAASGLGHVPGDPLFARVDVVGGPLPMVMEIEAIEPRLYFDVYPAFAEALVCAVEERYGFG